MQPLQQPRFVRAELGERLMHRRTHDLQLLRLQCMQRAEVTGAFSVAAAAINANSAEHVSADSIVLCCTLQYPLYA